MIQHSLSPMVLSGILCVAVPLLGCGQADPRVVPVSGTVTVGGNPQADVVVNFLPTGDIAGAAKGSSGRTDAQGQFTLKTAETEPQAGAIVGTHQVMIRPFLQVGAEDQPKTRQSMVELPPQAADGSIRFEVPAGGTQEAHFEL